MISLRVIFIAILAIGSTSVVEGNHFSSQGTQAYITNLEEIFSSAPDRRAARDFINSFRTFWLNPNTSANLKETIMQVSDKIHARRGSPFPDYHLYLSTVLIFVDSNHPINSFNAWHEGIKNLFSNPQFSSRNINNLFELTSSMLNRRVIYATPAVQWDAPGAEISFEFTNSLIARVENTTLVSRVREDTIAIVNTRGKLNMLTGEWKGDHGRVNWEQSGFAPDMVNATFGAYTIDMRRDEVFIDNVVFHNRHYFSQPLRGQLMHRVTTSRDPEDMTYPRFKSNDQRYRINNLFDGLSYEGGFSQHGAKAIGSGTPEHPAIITVYREGQPFIIATSLNFALRQDQIVSNTCEIKLYLDTAYIYHPGLIFNYLHTTREISLIRDGNGISRSPFFNTFHNLSMDTEMIRWDMNSTEMELRRLTGASINRAFFESTSFFTESFFNQLQGMDAVHPLQGLLNFSRHLNGASFTAASYANFIRMPENQVRQQVIGLSFHGFVQYNINTDTITIRDRLTDFLLFRAEKKDHDMIRFNSSTPGYTPNAIIDLKNFDLVLNGVSTVYISDRKNVLFHPANERLILKENRGIVFDGKITAGLINLHGNSFTFDYEEFKVNLNVIDSMSMVITTEEERFLSTRRIFTIGNTISQLSGYLEIDKPDNKSGQKAHPEFPKLTSNSNSYVFYDHPTTQGGAYNRESFFFHLDPFEIDSLNSLTRKNIAFTGRFNSSILPVLEERLVVQPDFSLGFRRETPPEGYPIYNGRAVFKNDIELSNQGLLGSGSLEYLTSEAVSEEFTFLPEKVNGVAKTFNISPRETGVEFPDVQAKGVTIEFLPFMERLRASGGNNNFTLYNNETTLSGRLEVTPNGLEGSGQLNMPNASLVSNRLDLGHHEVHADSSDFTLAGEQGGEQIQFGTTNLVSSVNFKTRLGTFHTRETANMVNFTENRFVAYIKGFSWNMDQNDIFLGARGGAGNRFVSTHRQQDSLEIIIPIAVYDVESGQIKAEEVESIEVADTRMMLYDGMVTINRNAVIDTLEKVTIVIDDSEHAIRDARVKIAGKNEFSATGKYDFINGAGNTETITFDNIRADREGNTIGEGKISGADLFTFDNHFAFKGDVTLRANNPLLLFRGGAQMLHACSVLGPQSYVRFESEINPLEVKIPIEETPRDYEFENIYANFFLNRDSSIIYSSFLEGRLFHTDVPLLSAKGYLFFNPEINSFIITGPPGIHSPDTASNIMRFHNSGCFVTGEGVINIGLDLGQVRTFAAGDITHSRPSGETRLNTILGVNFMLDNASVELMVNGYRGSSGKKGNPSAPATIKRLGKWLGMKTARIVASELAGTEKTRALPPEHQHMIVLDGLELTWDQESRSYLANTSATLLYIKDNPINLEVEVKATITFNRGGNSLEMLIKATEEVYFFFGYRNGIMQTRSSIAEYNTNVQTLETDERVQQRLEGQRGYTFILAPESRVQQLLRRFEPPVEQGETLENEEIGVEPPFEEN